MKRLQITLKRYISLHGSFEYSELMDMLMPVMKSLVTLHKHGIIHRDISPDNLMIGMDNNMYLIDFGAVKEMDGDKTTTVLLKVGYAPPEQYLHDGDIGAWTDVYGLCASIYTALSGKVPADSVARLQGRRHHQQTAVLIMLKVMVMNPRIFIWMTEGM